MTEYRARAGAAFCALAFLALLLAACSPGGTNNGDDHNPPPPPTYPTGADWTTYQGNASHTGYVPVTLDPKAFSERYVVTLDTVPLNPVACAGDWVYVTNDVYFPTTPQAELRALNALTGEQVWFALFGAKTVKIDPPAYNKGKVFVETVGLEESDLYAFEYDSRTLSFQREYMNQWSTYYAPTPFGDDIYVPGGYFNGVYAMNGMNSALLWNVPLDDYASDWTPAVDNEHVYFYVGVDNTDAHDYRLCILDRATGQVAFEIADPNSWVGLCSFEAPVIGSLGNILVTNQGASVNRLMSFDLAGRSIGYEIVGDFQGQVTLANGTIYVFNGSRVEARREADGAFLWSWEPPAQDPPWTLVWTTIATNNLLFVSCMPWNYTVYPEPGMTFAVDLATHQTVWTYPHGGHLALNAKGILFIATWTGQLAAVNVK